MGWNKGYEIMEKQIVNLYNIGAMDMNVLDCIMDPFANTDIDSGGSNYLKTEDGKTVEEVVCFIMEPDRYQEIMHNFVPDPDDPEYNERMMDLYSEITKREWKFW